MIIDYFDHKFNIDEYLNISNCIYCNLPYDILRSWDLDRFKYYSTSGYKCLNDNEKIIKDILE